MAAATSQTLGAQPTAKTNIDRGLRYCPAPWADNSEFFNTHYGIDAKTGVITKYTGTVHPATEGMPVNSGEEVLYAPPNVVMNTRRPANANPAQQAYAQPGRPKKNVAPATMTGIDNRNARGGAMRDPKQKPNAYSQPEKKKSVKAAPANIQRTENGKPEKKRLPWWRAIIRKKH